MAVSLPLATQTAIQASRAAGVSAGTRLLIVGASGGVGVYAVQIARYPGAHVTAVCSGRNAALVKSLGADEIIDEGKGMSKSNSFGGRTSADTVLAGKNMTGKNVIVTGANAGIGFEKVWLVAMIARRGQRSVARVFCLSL